MASIIGSIPGAILLGGCLGLLATLVMDIPMRQLAEGMTVTYVAASVLTGVDPDAVTARRAKAVHYASGAAAGVLFLFLVTLMGGLVGGDVTRFGLRTLLALLGGGLLVFGWLVGFFSFVVLPRYPHGMARQRLRQLHRDWRVAAAVYVTALAGLWLLVVVVV